MLWTLCALLIRGKAYAAVGIWATNLSALENVHIIWISAPHTAKPAVTTVKRLTYGALNRTVCTVIKCRYSRQSRRIQNEHNEAPILCLLWRIWKSIMISSFGIRRRWVFFSWIRAFKCRKLKYRLPNDFPFCDDSGFIGEEEKVFIPISWVCSSFAWLSNKKCYKSVIIAIKKIPRRKHTKNSLRYGCFGMELENSPKRTKETKEMIFSSRKFGTPTRAFWFFVNGIPGTASWLTQHAWRRTTNKVFLQVRTNLRLSSRSPNRVMYVYTKSAPSLICKCFREPKLMSENKTSYTYREVNIHSKYE